MSFWLKLRGTIENIFQLGLGGPNLKNNSGVIEARNAADSTFTIVRGAGPVGDSDLTTKQYVDTLTTRTVISGQFNGSTPLPANTGTEQFFVVSTTGVNATIGQLIWDDGTGVGTATVLAAAPRVIITQTALIGGTVTFLADSQYFWDSVAVAWLNIGGSLMSGAVRTIKQPITNAATQDSATIIPANATVIRTLLDITTPYSGGATISVGQAGSLSLLQATTDNLATVAGQYQLEQDVAWGVAALSVRVTVSGAPAAGAGFCVVDFTQPNA